MALSDFEDDPYRNKVFADLGGSQVQNPTNVGVGTGIAGPQDGFMASGGGTRQGPGFATSPSTGGFDLEKTRQAWAAPGIGGRASMADLQKFLADNANSFTQGVTLRGEKLYDPSGKFMFDAIGNYKSGDPNQMTRIALDGIGSNGKPRVTGPKGRPGGLTTVDSGHGNDEFLPDGSRNPKYKGPRGSGGAGGSAPPAANPFLTQIRQLIMERLGKMGGDPSLDDPALKAQSEAYRVSRERGAQQQRAAMAERAAANGTLQGGQSSGSFDTTLQGIYEDVGQDIAGNDAQLLGNETMQRRAEVQNLLNMALQSGDAESARALQLQLAKMDEALRKQQLSQQNRQFNADLGYRNRALDQSGRQWDDQFGWNQNRGYEDDYRWRVLYGL